MIRKLAFYIAIAAAIAVAPPQGGFAAQSEIALEPAQIGDAVLLDADRHVGDWISHGRGGPS